MNTRLVRVIARKFANSQFTEEDLVQEGMIAYMRAEATFNPTRDTKFETYASRVIRNRFIDLMRKKSPTQELHEETTNSAYDFESEIDIIEIKKVLNNRVGDLERAIFNSYIEGFTYEEISQIFDLPRKKIDNIIQKVKGIAKSALL